MSLSTDELVKWIIVAVVIVVVAVGFVFAFKNKILDFMKGLQISDVSSVILGVLK